MSRTISTALFTPMQKPAVFASFTPMMERSPPPWFPQTEKEFPVSRRPRERGVAAPKDFKPETPTEHFHLLQDAFMERRIPDDAARADLALPRLELRLDEDNQASAVLDQPENRRDHQPEAR